MVHRNRKDRGDAAVGSSVIAFLVAGVLFMASVVAVLVTTRTGSDSEATSDAPDSAASQIQAKGLADLLLQSPGHAGSVAFGEGLTASLDGKIANADELTRLGLMDPDAVEPFMMDFAKFQNLRLAPLAAADDDFVNYEEALEQFGLQGTGVNFHIRSYPSLKSTQDILANLNNRDDNLRVAYIGDGTGQITSDVEAAATPGLWLALQHPTEHLWECVVAAGSPPNYCPTGENPLQCTGTTKGFHIETKIRNVGETDTQFEGIFTLTFANGDVAYHKVNTDIVPRATGEALLAVDVTALPARGAIAARSCSGLIVNLKVYDTAQQLADITRTLADDPSPVGGPETVAQALSVDVGSTYYEDDDRISIAYGGFGMGSSDDLILTLCTGTSECLLTSTSEGCTAGVGCIYRVNNVGTNQNQWEFDHGDIDEDDIDPDTYVVRLYRNFDGGNSARLDDSDNAGHFIAKDLLLIVPDGDEIAGYTPPDITYTSTPGVYSAGSQVGIEVNFVDAIMGKFCPFWFESDENSPLDALDPPPDRAYDYDPRCDFRATTTPAYPDGHLGDVYPQDKQTLKRALQERLLDSNGLPTQQWTDILVIGSNVDHNKLTSQDIKGTIGDWVLAGGTLIVFGSSEMSTHWLESVFHVAIESSSTGINVPDQNHPVLNVPNDLNWPSYVSSYAWSLKVTGSFDAEAAFTRVVNVAGTAPNAILAVSDPGAFGAGSVILTGWTPWNLEQDGDGPSDAAVTEGQNLVHNLLMLGYRDLYLDYGPTLPSKRTSDSAAPVSLANVVPEIRSAQICHPDFDDPTTPFCDDPIPLRFEIYVF